MKERDNHPADLISREILSKGKKALVIYGTAHLGLFGARKYFNLRAQTDAKQPGAWFVVVPYVGYLEKPCTAGVRARHTRLAGACAGAGDGVL